MAAIFPLELARQRYVLGQSEGKHRRLGHVEVVAVLEPLL